VTTVSLLISLGSSLYDMVRGYNYGLFKGCPAFFSRTEEITTTKKSQVRKTIFGWD
jgi:hypothetical protein